MQPFRGLAEGRQLSLFEGFCCRSEPDGHMQSCSLTVSGMDNFTCPNASQHGYVTTMSPGHCCKTVHCPAATNEKHSVSVQYNISIHYTTRLGSLSQHLSCALASSGPNGAAELYYSVRDTIAAFLPGNYISCSFSLQLKKKTLFTGGRRGGG